MPVRIAQISDLHCGSLYFLPDVARTVVDEVNELDPDLCLVTGDITDNGYRREYEMARDLIGRITCETIVLPGNHDARNVGEVHFEEFFGRRDSEVAQDGVRLLGIDSSEPDLDGGHVGREKYRALQERFADPDEFKILALHHHLVPVPGTGRERNVVYDAGDLLRVLSMTGVDLVFCGHKHVPNVWRLDDMIVVNAGTACSLRLRGRVRPCYNLVEIHESGRVCIWLRFPGGDAELVADYRKAHTRSCRWRPADEEPPVTVKDPEHPYTIEDAECRE